MEKGKGVVCKVVRMRCVRCDCVAKNTIVCPVWSVGESDDKGEFGQVAGFPLDLRRRLWK